MFFKAFVFFRTILLKLESAMDVFPWNFINPKRMVISQNTLGRLLL